MPNEDLFDLVHNKILRQAGVDFESRPVLVFYSCFLPDPKTANYSQLIEVMMQCLDAFVESDYVAVFFSASSEYNPSWSWLLKAYRSLGRKYRKNLKSLYICHPEVWTKLLIKTMGTIISPKFASKLKYIPTLAALSLHVPIKQISIPEQISRHDDKVEAEAASGGIKSSLLGYFGKEDRRAPSNPMMAVVSKNAKPLVFGVEPGVLMGVNGEYGLPRVVAESISHIMTHGLDVEGVFRRSPASTSLAQVKQLYELNQPVDLDSRDDAYVHIACVLLKIYVRELPTPIFPASSYPLLRKLGDCPTDTAKLQFIKSRILTSFATPIYMLVKAIFALLRCVDEHRSANRMTATNLGIVWTPNLVKSGDATMDFEMCAMNGGAAGTVVKLCIEHYDDVF